MRDSINTISELIDYAIELNHEVIAFTEHDCVSNAIKIEKYYSKIKKEHPNFKVILGNEIYLVRDGLNNENYNREEDKYYHFILWQKMLLVINKLENYLQGLGYDHIRHRECEECQHIIKI